MWFLWWTILKNLFWKNMSFTNDEIDDMDSFICDDDMIERVGDDTDTETEESFEMPTKQVVCKVPPQGSYQCGRLMCSICSTLLGLCISSGVFPDPGSISPLLCVQLLESIMERSSKMQSNHMKDMDEMKQISEVLTIIEQEGMDVVKSTEKIECFGPLSHHHVSEQVSAEGCMIKGLDKVMEEDLKNGDGIVITTKGHTVYMMKVDEEKTYIFDPLYGSMDVVVLGGMKGAYDMMGYSSHRLKKDITGLENDTMYTGMIMKPVVVKPSLKRKEEDVEKEEIVVEHRATKMKVQIMEEATKVLENMRQEGGPVVQALRLLSNTTS